MRRAWFAAGLLLMAMGPTGANLYGQAPLGSGGQPATDVPEISANAPTSENPSPQVVEPQRPLATRQTAFSIPFSIDQAVLDTAQPVEVRLHVSLDHGKKWSLYMKQRPDAKKFPFRASGDGEYWFASRTIDSQGRSYPDGSLQPELKVIVDTHQPKFEFSATVGPSGDIRVAWNIFDPTLTPESFKLEYRPASGQAAWQSVFAETPLNGNQPGSLIGEHTFTAKSTSQVIYLQGEVRDDAGNTAVVKKRVYLPPPARRSAERSAERPVQELLSGLTGFAKRPFEQAEATSTPADPFASRRPAPIDTGEAGVSSAGDASAEASSSISAPADSSPGPFTIPAGGAPAVVAGPSPQKSANPSTQEWLPSLPKANDSVADVRQYPPSKSPTHPPVASRFASNSAAPSEPEPEVVPSEKPSFTTARHFNLDYDTDSVGPSGVAAVELWGTSDGGRNWTKWGVDADKQSPIRVDVEGDGLYGFCVVVESGLGLAGPRPHSGDAADMWVAVDGVKPTARLTSAMFGSGEQVGQFDIRWEAADENLSPRPVTLSFAEQSSGPWTTIAAGLPNNGRYLWNADPRLPRQIYLRLEVRDEAGNIGEHLLTDPLSTEGLSPKGRIRGVRPIDDNTQGAAARRVVR